MIQTIKNWLIYYQETYMHIYIYLYILIYILYILIYIPIINKLKSNAFSFYYYIF